MRQSIVFLLMIGFLAGCSTVNVEQERATLMRLDREWAASVKDMDKFMSYYASDASVYPAGMPIATGSTAIREALTKMFSAPGFSLQFEPSKAEVSNSGDVGYTTGTYQASMNGMTEKGKYIEVWKKQTDGQWKVKEDIFNPDGSGATPTSHVWLSPLRLSGETRRQACPPARRWQ
jgi:ketosteroid isomerase-like protein